MRWREERGDGGREEEMEGGKRWDGRREERGGMEGGRKEVGWKEGGKRWDGGGEGGKRREGGKRWKNGRISGRIGESIEVDEKWWLEVAGGMRGSGWGV